MAQNTIFPEYFQRFLNFLHKILGFQKKQDLWKFQHLWNNIISVKAAKVLS